jgi:hypothetical protein
MSFFEELGRRTVIRIGIACAIVAWLVMRVADIVLETIGAAAWVMQTLMLLLAAGFVITVIFARAYEFMAFWRGSACDLSWVSLETGGNEAFGRDLLRARDNQKPAFEF